MHRQFSVNKMNRRELLRVGGLGAVGLTLPQLLAARASSAENITGGGPAARADSCIVLYLNGGPSHLDMWDMKPKGPLDIRGEFSPIATKVPGVQIGECFPKIASMFDKFAAIRSIVRRHAAAGSIP